METPSNAEAFGIETPGPDPVGLAALGRMARMAARCCWPLAAHGARRIGMNHHPTLPMSRLSRRSLVGHAVVGGAALGLGGRLGRALADDVTPSAGPVEFLWETRGDPDSPLGNPAFLAVAPDGAIWVADGDHDRFLIFSPDGGLIESWGETGSGEGQFDFTTRGWGGYDHGAIAFAPDGGFYIADPGNFRIQRFGPDRRFLTAWGSEGTEPGQFRTANDLVVDRQGRVYVLDTDRVTAPIMQVFDADGRYLAAWGERGSESGQLNGPSGIGLDPDGTLLVAEFDGNRVQRFTPEGEGLDEWGGYGSADGEFVWAMDAAVDAAGRVFVADYANNRVQVFDRDGRFLAAWGEHGTDAGQFASALGVAVGADGTVYVTDAGKRLQAFRVGDLEVAGTPDS
jgi:DNA-binding beta-propeller fold protein YncE